MSVTERLNKLTPAARIKELELLVEKQLEVIDRLRKHKRAPFQRARASKADGCFTRILFGDVHGAYKDPAAVNAFLSDVETIKPKEVVCLGDLISCDGFLAEHHVIGVIPQLDYTYEEDAGQANDFLDRLEKVSDGALSKLLEGNHCGRVARQICKMTLRNPRDARFLEKMYGPAAVLNLERRGVEFIRRHECYDGLSVPGTIRLGPNAVAQHGEAFSGDNATRDLMRNLSRNVFHGHTHRLKILYGENMDGPLVGVNTGCLCQLRPLYGMTKTTGWCHGYAIEFVDPSSGFLAIPVPILNGKSYLAPLVNQLKL